MILICSFLSTVVEFDHVDSARCGYGMLNAEGPCSSAGSHCPDGNKCLF